MIDSCKRMLNLEPEERPTFEELAKIFKAFDKDVKQDIKDKKEIQEKLKQEHEKLVQKKLEDKKQDQ